MSRAAYLLAILLLAATAVGAASPPTLFMGELTWTEIRDAVQDGKTTVIIPIGGTEQSGPHIALNKHNIRVRFFAARIASSLGDALVAPVLAYTPEGNVSPPTEHMKYPGTITMPESTFEEILVAAGRSYRQHGFKDIVFIGDHGGYQRVLKRAAAALNHEWAGTNVRAHAIEEYYTAVSKDYVEALKEKGFTEEQIGHHAGLADTSLMLAIDPSLVRTNRMRSAKSGVDGVSGDPSISTPDLGKIGVDIVVKRSTEAIRLATRR
ncbi:MAG TPA: creatininase family protein [Usitatibacter sp.]|nr:creatininase family protein [Usitatibacter sp.]